MASALTAAALTLPAGQASAVTGPIDCPTALPTSQAVDGLAGTGYTVERGTTPDPFSAAVLGRITDGIAPGIDMILAELSSPALTRAGGVWAGMSGSPVYTADGQLIGSVSYGLAGASTIAGITPASDMQKLLSAPVAAAAKSTVKVSSALAKRLAKTGEVSVDVASQGFQLLKTPVSLSGAQGSRYSTFVKHLQKKTPNGIIRVGGSRASAAASSPSEITAGSNFAGALSYGVVTFAGVGTTTFVCSGKAVAFGHPFLAAGAVQLSAHTADAVTVQPDNLFGPFKVANPGGVVGVIDQDRIPGIRARLGATPSTFDVTSKLSQDGGTPVAYKTTVVYQPFTPDISAIHALSSIDALRQSFSGGSATTRLQINGLRANGTAFSLRINDHVADPFDLSAAVANQVYSTVSQLIDQPFEKIKITGISLTADISDDVNVYRVTSLKVANSQGTWIKPPAVIKVSQGKVIKTQLTLTKYQSTDKIVVPISVRAPLGTSGLAGILDVEGGQSFSGDDADITSFTGLLKSIAAAPTNDTLVETLTLDTGGKPITASSAKHIAGTVNPYSTFLDVQVR